MTGSTVNVANSTEDLCQRGERGHVGNRYLTFFTPEGGAVHCFAHYSQDEGNGILYRDVILVILLQQALCCSVVGTNTRSLPTGIVS